MLNKSWFVFLLVFSIVATENISIAQDTFTSYKDFSDSLQGELMDLKWSEKEVRDIDRILPGKIFMTLLI